MKRRRRAKKNHNYSVLEPRQLLATTGLPQFDGDSSIDTGLIVNGNFDQNEIADRTSEWVNIDNVGGWSRTDGASEVISLVGFDDSPRGTGFHLDDQANVLESIFQDVNTESGQQYTLAFDLLGREVEASADATSNDLRILWDGAEIGTFRGITDFWQTFTVDVTGGSADLTRLEIQEVDGAGNDGTGALLDNMRLVPVSSQSLENGSFENNETGAIDQDNLPGWRIVGDDGERVADVQAGTGSEGTRFVNLDRRTDNADILFTDVTTEVGGIYFVSFDLRSESGVVGEDEEVRVRWNDTWAGTYRGNTDWQGFGFTVRADSESTRLVFREPGGTFTGDGDGPLLDNIRITRVIPSISVALTDNSTAEFTENDGGLIVGTRIGDITSNVVDAVTGFTVALPDSSDVSTESLTAVGPDSVIESVDGVLNFEADLSISEFQNILRSLAYQNNSENPTVGTRAISVQVNAADISSPAATINVNVTPVNDAPVISDIADGTANVGEVFTVQASAADSEGDTVTWTVSATGSAIRTTDAQPNVDAQGNISWTPARVGSAVFTLQATDGPGLSTETQFAVTVTSEIELDQGTVLVNSGTDLPLFDSTAATDPAIGATIANFEAQTITGGTFNSFEPGVARIYSVLAHWCPFCQQELPEITEWLEANDLGDDVEFVAAAVAVDPSRDNYPVADWFEREDYEGTIIVDNPQSRLMDILGTRSFPFLVAVNANGEVVDRFSGLSTAARLDAALAAIRAS